MNIKIKFVDAALFVIGPMLAPVLTGLKAGIHTAMDWWIMGLGALMGGCGALAAYRSTKYAESKFTLTEKP